MTKTAVIALGGNAFTLPGQSGSCAEILCQARTMAASVNEVIEAGWRVVIVHGNGPQVGNLAMQQESTTLVPAQPLAMLGAMTQGQLGSLIALSVDELRGMGSAACVVTHVIVDEADPAFQSPTKPIGPFFERERAQRLAADRGWVVRPDAGRGYRRVVASPEPTGIVEIDAIRALVDAGFLVIAAGGGGIPLNSESIANLAGGNAAEKAQHIDALAPGDGCIAFGQARSSSIFAEAVIDKDRAARLLATLIGAQALLMVTAVDRVMLDFGTPRQRGLTGLTADEAARYLSEGQFPPGSMGPKVGAALQFLANGGQVAIITSPGLLADTLAGSRRCGTRIERSPSRVTQGQ